MITSVANREIRALRRLRTAENRARQGLVLVEGRVAVEAVIEAGATIDRLVTTPRGERACADTIRRAREAGARRIAVNDAVMSALCETASPPPLLAIVPKPVRPLVHAERHTWLLLDDVHDPRALGAILQTAAAAGCDLAGVTATSADPFAPKVVRASAAAAWRVRVEHPALPEELVARAEAAGFAVAALDDGVPSLASLPDRLLVVIGPATRLCPAMRIDVSPTEPALPATLGVLALLLGRARTAPA